MPDLKSNQNYNQRINQMMSQVSESGNGENFKLGIILLSVFILVLLVIFGTYLFRSKKLAGQIISPTTNQVKTESPSTNNSTNNVANINNNVQDSDKDGLSDQDETNIYKTDPNKADTDSDGLTDGEEVKVYKTNPLKADTDGDGMSDGEEIKLRRDPLDPNPAATWPPKPTNLSTKK